MVFLPFPTTLITDAFGDRDAEQVAAIVVGLKLPGVTVALHFAIAVFLVVPVRELRHLGRRIPATGGNHQ